MTRTISCRLSLDEWLAFRQLCRKNKVNYQDMFRAIVMDALVEDGYDALRCREQEGRSSSGEASEAAGATTP